MTSTRGLNMLILLVLSCGDNSKEPTPFQDTGDPTTPNENAGLSYAIVTGSDYSNGLGALSSIQLDSLHVQDNLVQNLHSDALTVVVDATIFQINRLGGDSIRVYEWGEWASPSAEWSTGENTNPQSLGLCEETVVTSLYKKDHLALYTIDGIIKGQIDLSNFVSPSDTDGSPEAASIVNMGTSLYVALQQLDMFGDYSPSGPGIVLEVDCDSLSIEDHWEVGPNPDITPIGTDLLIRTGSYGNFDGGVRSLNTLTKELSALFFTDSDIEVWISGITGTETGRIILNGFDVDTFESVLLCGDATGVIEVERSSNYYTHLTSNVQNEIWLSTDQGIRVFDPDLCTELTESPLQTSLQPTHVSFY
jgi:hypothetical protein